MNNFFNSNKSSSGAPKRSSVLLGFNRSSRTNEEYKHLRTTLVNTFKADHCPVIAVVAPKANTGSATVSSNLAISFAQLRKRILLIDGNMRAPKIAKYFGIESERGLSDLISMTDSGVFGFSGTVLQSGIDFLDILPAGEISDTPAELLASQLFRDLLESIKDRYDYIFICLPPVCDVADASVVTDIVSGYVLTLRSEKTNARDAVTAIERLRSNGGNVIGTVLNDISPIADRFLNK